MILILFLHKKIYTAKQRGIRQSVFPGIHSGNMYETHFCSKPYYTFPWTDFDVFSV